MRNITKTLLLFGILLTSTLTNAQVGVSISARIAPPPLEVYSQPYAPGDGYIWTPGYWGYGDDGYYWVPGVWVMPPSQGLLWTPGYWGFNNGLYQWNGGYWGNSVGYYGGINYGYGYGGRGYNGGRWQNGHFFYNSAVSHVNRNIHNTYVGAGRANYAGANHSSYNGRGGVNYRAQGGELRGGAGRQQPTAEQNSHFQSSMHDRGQFSSPQQMHPAATSMDRVGGNRFNSGGHMMGGGAGGGMHGGGGGMHGGGGGGMHGGGGGHR
jgi:hypothetical protein